MTTIIINTNPNIGTITHINSGGHALLKSRLALAIVPTPSEFDARGVSTVAVNPVQVSNRRDCVRPKI
jgi:hypothetical protein